MVDDRGRVAIRVILGKVGDCIEVVYSGPWNQSGRHSVNASTASVARWPVVAVFVSFGGSLFFPTPQDVFARTSQDIIRKSFLTDVGL